MRAVEIQAHARKLYDVRGPNALILAAEMVRRCENSGDDILAKEWRRIADALQAMRGTHVS